jgi:predicted HTH transcriptional regulator
MGLSEGEIAALRSRTYSGIKKQNESLQEKLGLDEGVAAYVLRVAEELCGTPTRSISQNSTLKGTLKSTWSDTLKGTQKKIVEIIINNPNVTIPQVAEQLDLNPRGIAKHFKALQEKGVIRRVGPDKGGHWEVIG